MNPVGSAWIIDGSSDAALAFLGPTGFLAMMIWSVLVGYAMTTRVTLPAHVPGERRLAPGEIQLTEAGR